MTVAADAVAPARSRPLASGVLAERVAAALVHREPGWQLPRRSALARRYNVSMAEMDAALAELARRSLVRRLPGGQFYRASPAEYLIPLEGAGGLNTRLDPMGAEITCQARRVSRREAPQDVAGALGVAEETPLRVIRCVWAVAVEPVAVSTAYLREDGPAGPDDDDHASFQAVLNTSPTAYPGSPPARAGAVNLEMMPPQPAVARSLRMTSGIPVISVTIRFDDDRTGAPVGLTAVALKPDQFRVVIQAGDTLPGGFRLHG